MSTRSCAIANEWELRIEKKSMKCRSFYRNEELEPDVDNDKAK